MRHYVYNAWDVCRLQGVYSIELWRVGIVRGRVVNCLACVAMVR